MELQKLEAIGNPQKQPPAHGGWSGGLFWSHEQPRLSNVQIDELILQHQDMEGHGRGLQRDADSLRALVITQNSPSSSHGEETDPHFEPVIKLTDQVETKTGYSSSDERLVFESSETVSVVSTFDELGLKEDLLRGIYAYSSILPPVTCSQQPSLIPIMQISRSLQPFNRGLLSQ